MKQWLQAVRPQTLTASLAPILLSQVVAFLWLDNSSAPGVKTPTAFWGLAALVLACALCLQMAVNLANDYFDYFSGVDNAKRQGPVRLGQRGDANMARVRHAFVGLLVIGVALGVWLASLVAWELLWLGLFCVLCVLAYTAGPLSPGLLRPG